MPVLVQTNEVKSSQLNTWKRVPNTLVEDTVFENTVIEAQLLKHFHKSMVKERDVSL